MRTIKFKAIRAIQPRKYPTFTNRREQIQVVERFKCLDIDVLDANKWIVCYEPRVQTDGIVITCLRINHGDT